MSETRVIDGHMLSAEHCRIAEIINDYDPTLSLAWIPPDQRHFDDTFPFAVVHDPLDAPPYIVFKLRENEVDHRVLARLFAGDNAKNDPVANAEAMEAAQRLMELKKEEEYREEQAELAKWAIKARPGAKHNGVRFD
jgi:hypothetical protein